MRQIEQGLHCGMKSSVETRTHPFRLISSRSGSHSITLSNKGDLKRENVIMDGQVANKNEREMG